MCKTLSTIQTRSRSAAFLHSPRSSSRQGITLLFVVSMIVLFLLMGTAFVVLAGDFMKTSKARLLKETHIQEGTELVDRAIYDLIREPDVRDLSSPLRFVGLLSDMYGYGFRATAIAPVSVDGGGELIRIDVINPTNLLDDTLVLATDFEWGGLVLTFVKGEQTGLSARILRHEVVDPLASPVRHRLTLFPEPGNTEFRTNGDLTKLTSDLVSNLNNVIVNGRPFAGTGTNSAQQNQSGQTIATLTAAGGHLALPGGGANHAATNEPFDAFDQGNQNIFLAGINPDGTVRHSSFYRDGITDFAKIRDLSRPAGAAQFRLVDNTNSGQLDGIWMDLGMQPRYSREGIRYKPFVSYTVVDLDSRINVNVHGNQFSTNGQLTSRPVMVSSLVNRGSGYGVAEIDLNLLFPTTFMQLMQGTAVYPGRYGVDGQPGEAGVRDAWSTYKLSSLPFNPLTGTPPGTIGREYGSPHDIHGRFSIGYPSDLVDVWNPMFNIGLPCTNVATSVLVNETIDSAYESRVSDASSGGPRRSGPFDDDDDQPFHILELERILRRFDIDVNLLPDRLLQLGGGPSPGSEILQAANSITTHSYEVPTLYENLPRKLAEILLTNGVPQADLRDQVELMLAPEILRGLPLNINRPLPDGLSRLHPSGNYPYSAATWVDYHQARYDYARHLYMLVLLITERPDLGIDLLEYRRLIAQWAINVVDFRDNDSIMSHFEVDLDPWDGWDVDGRLDLPLTATETAIGPDRHVVWGAERPELLITETFASHDRRAEDTTLDASGQNTSPPGTDPNYDSRLVPNVSFFAELYNPWVMDDANQDRVPELWDTSGPNFGVDLQRTTPDGTPVWRMVVTVPDPTIRVLNPDDPTFVGSNIIRRIYFNHRAGPGPTNPDVGQENTVYFPAAGINTAPVQRGRYAIVGSYVVANGDDYITYFGRRQTATPDSPAELALTRRFILDPVAQVVKNYVWNTVNSQMDEIIRSDVVALPVGQTFAGNRNLGISDPVAGYAFGLPPNVVVQAVGDGFKYYDSVAMTDYAFDEPVDITAELAGNPTVQYDGVDPNLQRTVHLQRLTNPLLNYDAETNPYRTIDSSPVNVLAFNGAEDSTAEGIVNQGNLGLVSFERESYAKNLFRNTLTSPPIAAGTSVPGDQHFLSFEFDETFGRLNDKYLPDPNVPPDPNGFAWLTWNNRPYISQYELANVPYLSSYHLTRSFNTIQITVDPYQPNPTLSPQEILLGLSPIRGQFDHLLNFYADTFRGGGATPGLHRVVDFTEVPSRFVGTERFLNPLNYAPPLDTISSYRYPGKLNLNTILGNSGGAPNLVWNSLMRSYRSEFPFSVNPPINWETLRDTAPLRPGGVWNSATNPAPSSSTLFRVSVTGSARPIPFLDFDSEAPYNNSRRSAYFRNDARQRLGNLVTGRSSVFAIWVTVGYFEVDENGTPRNDNLGGIELGAETGEVKRHRGFYIFDRSIPVAFEPGKNHNIENAILVRRIIE